MKSTFLKFTLMAVTSLIWLQAEAVKNISITFVNPGSRGLGGGLVYIQDPDPARSVGLPEGTYPFLFAKNMFSLVERNVEYTWNASQGGQNQGPGLAIQRVCVIAVNKDSDSGSWFYRIDWSKIPEGATASFQLVLSNDINAPDLNNLNPILDPQMIKDKQGNIVEMRFANGNITSVTRSANGEVAQITKDAIGNVLDVRRGTATSIRNETKVIGYNYGDVFQEEKYVGQRRYNGESRVSDHCPGVPSGGANRYSF